MIIVHLIDSIPPTVAMSYFKMIAFLCFFSVSTSYLFAQDDDVPPPPPPPPPTTIIQQKMKQLDFLVGNWVGTSTTFKNGVIDQQVPAYEQIQYKLDQTLITLDLHSSTLQLHTLIYYDVQEATYFYCPYGKNRQGKYKGEYRDGKFLVQMSDAYRLVFQRTEEGQFMEYGELLKDGVWTKKFEDVFENIK